MENNEINKLIKIFVGVSFLFALFFVVTTFVKKETYTSPLENVEIQYKEILVGDILNKGKDEYFVLAYDFDGVDKELFEGLVETYTQKENSLVTYSLNLTNVFNRSFRSEQSNLDVQSIKEIRFSGPALIKIKGNKINEVFEGKDKIVETIQKLVKAD